jgi:hypothetical protein
MKQDTWKKKTITFARSSETNKSHDDSNLRRVEGNFKDPILIRVP